MTVLTKLAFALLMMGALQSAASAQDIPFDDFRQADLIFQETTGRQSIAVKAATGSPYTHMGIIRMTGGGPVVIEAGRTVTETSLNEFIARGAGKRFSVYRMDGLSGDKAHEIIEQAQKDYEKPYDLYFRLDGSTIYCSELPFRAFKAAGIDLGEVEKVGDLNINVAAAVALIDRRWQQHPDCKGGSKEACIDKLNVQDIVTPVSIARDKKLTQMFSNF